MERRDTRIRVRMAPSPTGFFHIGSARTALYNWLFARHNQGRFILRIEDTDTARSSREMIDVILDGMRWLGLDWDEGPEKGGDFGPYFQSERKDIYREYADKLKNAGKAYWCYCTADEIEKERSESYGKKLNWQHRCRERYSAEEIKKRRDRGLAPALRFVVPQDKKITFDDLIHGRVEKSGADLEDFVILKSDSMPTYNFACVIDDSLMKITHVIRGVEHIANTPKQALLYEALSMTRPDFCHLPIILGPDKKKLSKRLGAKSVVEYKNEGYLPEALVNFLGLLGWSPGGDEEIMSLERMTELFTLERINPANAIYDESRLRWMNNQYIINHVDREAAGRYRELVLPYLFDAGLIDRERYGREKDRIDRICNLMRPRLKVLSDITKASYFFTEEIAYDDRLLEKFLKPETVDLVKEYAARIGSLAEKGKFFLPELEKELRGLAGEKAVAAARIIHPLRIFITGKDEGAGLFETMELIGAEQCLKRIKNIARKYEEKIGRN